ncbi:peptide ABC transporter ATP-binding protein [Bacillus canaveralius]|uniref:Peptide ABC transporter ATP-binding protein n=1 Tax=Bacillus canaveralius TaxID=1403243 RepID=A0A2N5GL57_9BACI|nr:MULTISPECIES: ABC transporter ATP-binding protein [Bacillus]PLR81252.1 peptide ABC transporter ATP-binding protein [Bacillus sp. V33-4]PLR82294.1 peptide ABC transporter ATP-binding protein [Bacillus canaveralius]PLR99469.1 peptide ABC transporter ATP-binding protein [Bacillus canaveralius]RSK49094.1 ABC transporter ATP-binding protein [Bacillus canaveralius]
MKPPILEVHDLAVSFHGKQGVVPAVDGVSFEIQPSETVCIVGESGSGKSVTSLAIMGLLSKPAGRVDQGHILLEGEDLLKKSPKEMRKVRGNDIAMIFQEPMTSLNPVFTVGDQIAEALRYHKGLSKKEAMKKSVEFLRLVGIPSPEQRVHEYPHQLSGGMRQRVMIAMALTCDPKLLIADEPTTALDVTIQAQVLELMKGLKEKLGMSILLITHDLGVVADMADRVVVMYAGKVVEEGSVWEIFERPNHPYTLGLLEAMPSLEEKGERLQTIKGVIPNLLQLPTGCRFNPRCPFVSDLCRQSEPELEEVGDGRRVACWHYNKLQEVEVTKGDRTG